MAEEVLTHLPHNQFLVVLVYYGYPGLVLLVAFYLLIGRSILATAWCAFRSRDTESLLLVAVIIGALFGYGLNSMFHNAGPFDTDWSYFVYVGLDFQHRASGGGTGVTVKESPDAAVIQHSNVRSALLRTER